MAEEGRFGEMESLLSQIGAAEYAAQLDGGVLMSQGEIARAHELGVSEKDQTAFITANVRDLIAGTTAATRARAIELIRGAQGTVAYGDTGPDNAGAVMPGSYALRDALTHSLGSIPVHIPALRAAPSECTTLTACPSNAGAAAAGAAATWQCTAAAATISTSRCSLQCSMLLQ